MKYGLQTEQIRQIHEVFKKYPIEKAILYGSRAMGTYKEGSDIDLALQGPDLSMRDISNIETELDEILLPYKFDLLIYHQLKDPDVLAHIKRVGVVFYKS